MRRKLARTRHKCIGVESYARAAQCHQKATGCCSSGYVVGVERGGTTRPSTVLRGCSLEEWTAQDDGPPKENGASGVVGLDALNFAVRRGKAADWLLPAKLRTTGTVLRRIANAARSDSSLHADSESLWGDDCEARTL